MSLTIKAQIKASGSETLNPISVRVMVKTIQGGVETLAQKNTSRSGEISLSSNKEFNHYLPYIYLEYLLNRRWMPLDATPKIFTASTIDFKEIVIPSLAVNKSIATAAKSGLSRGGDALEGSEIDTLDEERLPVLERQVSQLKNEKTALSQQVSSLQSQVSNITQERNQAVDIKEALEETISQKDSKILSLQTELEAKSPKDTPINQLFENTGAQLEQAQVKLSNGGKRFSLGKVSMELKVLPGQSGNSVRVADTDLINEVGADALSTVTMEFNDDSSGTMQTATPTSQVVVPDISGYTKALAERTVKQSGLMGQWRHEYIVEADTHSQMNGRVIQQHPSAGTLVNERSTIVITLAKAAIL